MARFIHNPDGSYTAVPTSSRLGIEPMDPIKEIGARLILRSSEDRLEEMLRLISNQPPEVFWPVLIDWWNACDDTWRFQGELLALMRFQRDGASTWRPCALPLIGPRQWPVRIWRGCSRARVREYDTHSRAWWSTQQHYNAACQKREREAGVSETPRCWITASREADAVNRSSSRIGWVWFGAAAVTVWFGWVFVYSIVWVVQWIVAGFRKRSAIEQSPK